MFRGTLYYCYYVLCPKWSGYSHSICAPQMAAGLILTETENPKGTPRGAGNTWDSKDFMESQGIAGFPGN